MSRMRASQFQFLAIRRLIEGSVYSSFSFTNGGNRPERMAGGDPGPRRDPGVPVRVACADGTTRNVTLFTL
jgi:hypothetical protein